MKHESIEINAGLLIILTLVVISIGGLVEIVPLFHIKNTVEEVKGVRPYTPLELRGRDLYIREAAMPVTRRWSVRSVTRCCATVTTP